MGGFYPRGGFFPGVMRDIAAYGASGAGLTFLLFLERQMD